MSVDEFSLKGNIAGLEGGEEFFGIWVGHGV